MAITRTSPEKDNSAEGYEEPFNRNVDAVDVRGVYVQNDTSNDATVLVDRDASDNLTFTDPVTGTKTLAQLAAGSGLTSAQHKALRQLIHLADGDGPFEGFTTGAYQETLPASTPFPTSFIWYEDSTKAKKIVEETVTYNTNKTIATDQWKVYDTDGTTVLATVTDTITYSGVFELSRTRAIA